MSFSVHQARAHISCQAFTKKLSAVSAQPLKRGVWLIAFLLIADSFFTGGKNDRGSAQRDQT
jgi:hypothetical protein